MISKNPRRFYFVRINWTTDYKKQNLSKGITTK